MSDIVERLRHAHPSSQQYAAGSMILSDAADEIERLRADLKTAFEESWKARVRVSELEAENATLREALEKSQQAAPKENKV